MDGIKQNNVKAIIFPARFLLNVVLCYQESTTFLLLTTHFSSPEMILLRNGISLNWKKTCHYRYAYFLILLTKRVGNPAGCRLGCVVCKFSSTFTWIAFQQFSQVSWSLFDEELDLVSSLNDVSSERYFENLLLIWQSVMTPWPLTIQIFFAVSQTFSSFLNSLSILCWICTFTSKNLVSYGHRLNNDARSFLTKIRMNNEGTF